MSFEFKLIVKFIDVVNAYQYVNGQVVILNGLNICAMYAIKSYVDEIEHCITGRQDFVKTLKN